MQPDSALATEPAATEPAATEPAATEPAATEPIARQIALNRHRQREIYGAPLGERVRHLVGVLGITQARLARALGMSPAMLSQLVSGRRVKIGDPAALARFQMIDHRCARIVERPSGMAVDTLLTEVGRARWRWVGPTPVTSTGPARPGNPGPRTPCPAEALRRICPPAQLAAAAAQLGPGFPELAEALRQAAARR